MHGCPLMHGTLYKKSCTLVAKMDTDYPVFGKLLNIFVINYNEVYFEVQVLNTLEFNYHYHCFVLQKSSVKSTVKYNNLFSFKPHHIRTMPVCHSIIHYIVPKYYFTS